MAKVFGFVSIFIATALAAHLTLSYLDYVNAPPAKRLQLLWNRDTKMLADQNKLPKEWNDIREIVYITPTRLAKVWAKSVKAPIALNSLGKYKIEIMITDWQNKGATSAMIQYDLLDLKSGNVLWEFGRTFSLGCTSSKN